MTAYYNEFDPFAAAWLRELIKAGHIAPGDVDERSIEDVRPDDLLEYDQCHFFAGIGVWSAALRGAGWPDDRPVWTGSCPCQPFSAAGKGGGFDDERHLWPAWHHLIRECRPPTIFGEQVSAKDGLMWFDLVQADMEAEGYACGPLDICAAGVGAPHIRQRLYFVAHHHHQRLEGWRSDELGRAAERTVGAGGVAGQLALTNDPERGADAPGGHDSDGSDAGWAEGSGDTEGCGGVGIMDDSAGTRRVGSEGHPRNQARERLSSSGRETGELADASGIQFDPEEGRSSDRASCRVGREIRNERLRSESGAGGVSILGECRGASPTDGFWGTADWLLCRDPDSPRWRPVESGTFPLVDGSPARVGRLRGYGNAIVKPLAQTFIEVAMTCIDG